MKCCVYGGYAVFARLMRSLHLPPTVAMIYRPEPPAGDIHGQALDQQQAIVQHMRACPTSGGKPLSDRALSNLVKALGVGAVPHGFRSSSGSATGLSAVPSASKSCSRGPRRPSAPGAEWWLQVV